MTGQITPEHLSLLRCAECGRGLAEAASAPAEWSKLGPDASAGCLQCEGCGRRYPVTPDGIPLLWTEELRRCLLDETQVNSPLSANVSVYNNVSDDYARYWRTDSRNARRMKAAARKVLGADRSGQPERPLRHLDVGCGPGHVLHWLSGLPSQQVALDVSLSNLRNTRRSTRAFAVLGSAERMPFADGVFDLVTESSVLHHIESWDKALEEFVRVCGPGGGIVLDSEPSRESKDWSGVAAAVFGLRWYPYMLLSYVRPNKFWFRDVRTARLTFERAEIHNRPNTGLPFDEILALLRRNGMEVEAVRSPDEQLRPRARMPWQEMLLHALSGHNPLDSRYGWFSVIGRRPTAQAGDSTRVAAEAPAGTTAAGPAAAAPGGDRSVAVANAPQPRR